MSQPRTLNYPWISHALTDARRLVMVLLACMLMAQTVEASHDHRLNAELESCPICLQWGSGDVNLAPSAFTGSTPQSTHFPEPSYQSVTPQSTFAPQQLRAPPVH